MKLMKGENRMKAYYDGDADPEVLKHRKIAIVGYGSQGHAHANNLKDSGLAVVVGLRPGSPSRPKVEAAGLPVSDTEEAVFNSDVVMMLVPDELAPEVYKKQVAPNLFPGRHLAFAHGFSIHFS